MVESEIKMRSFFYRRGSREDISAAVVALRKAVKLRPQLPEYLTTLGAALREDEQFDEAAATLRQAVKMKPDLIEAHSNLGLTLLRMKNYDGAIAEFQAALKLDDQT